MLEYEINSGILKKELSVKLSGVTQFDEFRYRMIRENTIPGIIAPMRSQENDLTVYTYDITGMQPVANRFESKKFTLQDIKQLYIEIISILEKSEEYFLDKNCFLLSEQFIVYEEGSETYKLMYCPEATGEMKTQFATFTEYIVNQTEYSDKAAVTLVYDIFQMMRDDHSTIHEVLEYITEGRRQSKVNAKNMEQQNMIPVQSIPRPQPFVMNTVPPEVQRVVSKQPALVKNPFEQEEEERKEVKNGFFTKRLLACTATVVAGMGSFLAMYLLGFMYINHTKKLDMSKFGGIAVVIGVVVFYTCYRILEKKEEKPKEEPKKEKEAVLEKPQMIVDPIEPVQRVCTVQPVATVETEANMQPIRKQPIVEVGRKSCYRLVAGQDKSMQQFVLNKYPYVLGKSYEQVDGVVYSDAVSKVHAEFVEERGTLYVIDMSSTNGTFVNKRKIASNERVPVGDGDRIQIADKEYLLCS